jgi:hypothetical protein
MPFSRYMARILVCSLALYPGFTFIELECHWVDGWFGIVRALSGFLAKRTGAVWWRIGCHTLAGILMVV